jgi:hypothetical protein
MTRAYYFSVFGKTEVPEGAENLLLVNRSQEVTEEFTDEQNYIRKSGIIQDFEDSDGNGITADLSFSGNRSFQSDSTLIFSPPIQAGYSDIVKRDHAWIKITAYIYPAAEPKENPFSIVVHFTHNGYPYKYRTLDSENFNLDPDTWNKITFYYLTPEVRRKNDELKVYLWNRGKGVIYLDDLSVDIFEQKEK